MNFERIDTYADLYLNNKCIGNTHNGLIPYSFDITKALLDGENVLKIYFQSPIDMVKGKKKRIGSFTTERLYTRRMQCTYGWDWTARFVTCGLGEVCIEEKNEGFNFKSAYVYTKCIDEDGAAIVIESEIENFKDGKLLTYVILDENNNIVAKKDKYVSEPFVKLNFDIRSPKLWYPIGYGDPYLYKLQVLEKDESIGNRIVLDGDIVSYKSLYETTFGIRTVRILQLPDEKDSEYYNRCIELKKSYFSGIYDKNTEFSGFILKVNGKKIMCKGANWVPCEPYSTGDLKERVTKILEMAAFGGVNMIRIWGGGAFETKHFYNECSRLGLMVTQDFLMACGNYPEDEDWFIEELKKESEYAAYLIRNEACLMWWTGDNENAVMGSDKDENYMGRRSAYEGIGPNLYRLDPNREFLPSSPFGGNMYASNTVGTTHNTQYLGYVFDYMQRKDVSDYKEYFKTLNARFIAEEPCFGAISLPSLRKMMTNEDIFDEDTYMWLYHTKGNPALKKELFQYMLDFSENLCGKFKDPYDRFYKFKQMQCEWIRVSLERVRREKWFSSGIIYWMLNDCWPAASGWSLIDFYTMPKPAFYAFKRASKQIIASIDKIGNEYAIYLCNDGDEKEVNIKLNLVLENGDTKNIEEFSYISKANTSEIIKKLPLSILGQNETLIVDVIYKGNEEKNDRTFYKEGALFIKDSKDDIEIIELKDDYIKIKSNKFVLSVELEGNAIFNENMFTLLKNEEKVIHFKKTDEFDGININAFSLE